MSKIVITLLQILASIHLKVIKFSRRLPNGKLIPLGGLLVTFKPLNLKNAIDFIAAKKEVFSSYDFFYPKNRLRFNIYISHSLQFR